MNNKYFLLRHGESFSNVKEVISSWPETGSFPLTLKGEKEAREAAQKIKEKNIDLVFSSDLLRTKQTSGIVSKKTGIKPLYDKRLREYDVGEFNGRPLGEWKNFFKEGMNKFKNAPPGGENYIQVKERVADFLKETEKKFSGKKILIISHQNPLTFLETEIKGIDTDNLASLKEIEGRLEKGQRIKTGELREIVDMRP